MTPQGSTHPRLGTLRPPRVAGLHGYALGPTLVALFVVVAVTGPWLAPYDPLAIDLAHEFEGPSLAHWFGTGDNGIDILSALLHGARLAGVISVCVVMTSAVFGATVGMWAGYFGKAADHTITTIADVVQAFPSILLNIAMLALIAEPGLMHLIAALVVNGWVLYARLARAETLRLRDADFVHAAVALGASRRRILGLHIAPNLLGPLVVQATSGLGVVILAESTLSFLGLGPGKVVSWGALLDQGASVLLRFPHVALFSGGAIAITVLGFNLCGDWIRDQLDPRRDRSSSRDRSL